MAEINEVGFIAKVNELHKHLKTILLAQGLFSEQTLESLNKFNIFYSRELINDIIKYY